MKKPRRLARRSRGLFHGFLALLAVPLAACDQIALAPPVCSILGQISIEGIGIDGILVTLSTGESATTAGGGNFRFDDVEGWSVTVRIDGLSTDMPFDFGSTAETISPCDGIVTVNFSGSYIRTARVMGTVTVESMGLGGVTTVLSGAFDSVATTGEDGEYTFTGLRAGSYVVGISGFDGNEIRFPHTLADFELGVGEFRVVSFDGSYIRTAGIEGRVSIDGEGLVGVNVSATGKQNNADMTTPTDTGGQYAFPSLRAGDYTIAISGFDEDAYTFEATSVDVTLARDEAKIVNFEGSANDR